LENKLQIYLEKYAGISQTYSWYRCLYKRIPKLHFLTEAEIAFHNFSAAMHKNYYINCRNNTFNSKKLGIMV
jgi:hypothetical protein